MAKQKSKRKSPKPVMAWAWLYPWGMGFRVRNSREFLELDVLPVCTDAKPVCVMLVPMGEYRRMVAALKGK